MENILYYICGFGVLQGLLLAALIYFHPKSDKSISKFLALHIFLVSFMMIMPSLIKALTWRNSTYIQPLPFFIGPSLYFYLLSFKTKVTWKKALPHLIPAIVMFFPFYYNIESMKQKFPDSTEVGADVLNNTLTRVLVFVRLSHLFFYYFLSRRTLLNYQRSIHQLFSETTRISLQWARTFINGYLFLLVWTVIIFMIAFRFPDYFNLLLLINFAVAAPYIYIASYKGITQPALWQTHTEIKKEELEKELEDAEKKRPGLGDEKIGGLVQKITLLMEQEKIYHEPELTVHQLANRLQIPAYQVSQAINEGMKRNFYDLVNSYRVEEAKQLLVNPRNREFTVLSVGFEAGFNSKTTFNTVFKKFTGLTPTEYRDRQLQPASV